MTLEISPRKWDSNPGSFALEADALLLGQQGSQNESDQAKETKQCADKIYGAYVPGRLLTPQICSWPWYAPGMFQVKLVGKLETIQFNLVLCKPYKNHQTLIAWADHHHYNNNYINWDNFTMLNIWNKKIYQMPYWTTSKKPTTNNTTLKKKRKNKKKSKWLLSTTKKLHIIHNEFIFWSIVTLVGTLSSSSAFPSYISGVHHFR